MRRYLLLFIPALLLIASTAFAAPTVTARAGKLTVDVISQPNPPTVGENLLIFTVKDGDKPLSGAGVDVHIDMTSMSMPADIKAAPGSNPGEYGASVNFSMAGTWKVDVAIQQMAGMAMSGDGTAHFLIETGKGISAKSSGITIPWFGLFVVVIILSVTGAVVYRKRFTQRQQGIIVGILTLMIVLAGTIGRVSKYRDKKTATVLGSAFMNMDSSSAAPGTVAVTTETAQLAPFQSAASYTGTVVPDIEEDVYPRVTGRLVYMPLYPGDRVTAGQVIARLESDELSAKEMQAAYGSQGAAQGISAASSDVAAARAGVQRAQRGVEEAQAQFSQAQSAAKSADGGVLAAHADLDQANQGVIQAQGDVESAQADVAYWDTEIAREKKLFSVGAISHEELDRETAQAATAQAKLKQARAAVATAQAGVASAQARLNRAIADRDSANGRVAESRAAIQAAQADVQAAEAGVSGATAKAGVASSEAKRAEAELTEATTIRGYTTIRASNSGVVTARNIAAGTLVQPSMTILKIAKIDVVRLQVNVSEADLAQVRLGQQVTATTIESPNDPIVARISAIFPAQESATRTAIVEARIKNPGMRLKAGQYLNVALDLGDTQHSAISVPNSALISRDGQKSVFVATQDGMRTVAKRVAVTTGRINNQRTEILQGLSDGDNIIVSGMDNLQDGDAVTIIKRVSVTPPSTSSVSPLPNPAETMGMFNDPTPERPQLAVPASPAMPRAHATTRSTHVDPQVHAKQHYYCPMHVDMVSDKPGKCPKCGMDYIVKK